MKTKLLTRNSVKRKIRRLFRGKYKNSIAPCTAIAQELSLELNKIGVEKYDHLIAVMNMVG